MSRTRRPPHDAVPAALVVAVLDEFTRRRREGSPARERTFLNGEPLQDGDRRMIRRWRHGHVGNVRVSTVTKMLEKYHLPSEARGRVLDRS